MCVLLKKTILWGLAILLHLFVWSVYLLPYFEAWQFCYIYLYGPSIYCLPDGKSQGPFPVYLLCPPRKALYTQAPGKSNQKELSFYIEHISGKWGNFWKNLCSKFLRLSSICKKNAEVQVCSVEIGEQYKFRFNICPTKLDIHEDRPHTLWK